MREIKFRAWDSEYKYMMSPDEKSQVESEYVNTIFWLLSAKGRRKEIIFMEFTGLEDKNGVEIYEGDILKDHYGVIGNVFYHNGAFRISSDLHKLDMKNIYSYDDLENQLIEDNDLVIIGNIYESETK